MNDVGTVLTLGSNVTINEIGYAQMNSDHDAGDGIVNRGVINQSENSSVLGITGTSFTNDGTITANSDDSTLSIENNTVINNGTIAVSNGDTVNIDGANQRFSNSGSITVDSKSTLFLQGIAERVVNWRLDRQRPDFYEQTKRSQLRRP